MDKNKSISTQKINRWDVGYFILYGIVLAKCVYETTMFSQQVLVGTFKLFLAAMVLYTGAKVLFSGYYSRKEQLAIAVVVLIFGIVPSKENLPTERMMIKTDKNATSPKLE